MENIAMYCKRKKNAKVKLGLKWLIVSHTGLIVTMERDYDKCKKKKKGIKKAKKNVDEWSES